MRNKYGGGPQSWLRLRTQILTAFVGLWTIVPLVLTQKTCMSDYDCSENQFCRLGVTSLDQSLCTDCRDCVLQFNRYIATTKCVREPRSDCGDCLPGYKSSEITLPTQRENPSTEKSDKCEPTNPTVLSANSADFTDTDNESSNEGDDSTVSIATGTYVGFTILGILIGGIAGASVTAGICYIRIKKENKKKASQKDAQKETELQIMSPDKKSTYVNGNDSDQEMHNNRNGSKYNGNTNGRSENDV